jgi:predicted ABC-type ATPase
VSEQGVGARPHVLILAGPNGAGKSTAAPWTVPSVGILHFVNADVIAQGLSGFNADAVAIQAGRVMLTRLKQLASERASFAFETTLASRNFVPWIAQLRESGYVFHLYFFWLPTPELAVERVATRVSQGGHGVPEETIRRRYTRGLENFFRSYLPLADDWRLYNASGVSPVEVAFGYHSAPTVVLDATVWQSLVRTYASAEKEH